MKTTIAQNEFVLHEIKRLIFLKYIIHHIIYFIILKILLQNYFKMYGAI